MLATLVQIAGALLILLPFAWQQIGTLTATSALYLWPNFLGSSILGVIAVDDRNWGFVLLEAVWALVALRGLVRSAVQNP